ncbi:glycosyltransferase family 2 protein, partial [Patescibacteria group bacterium]|nr:glycosyltransferase family 2 protein [Patescibacteria group bacterium]
KKNILKFNSRKLKVDVSIIFVTYNGKDFFEDCIESVKSDIGDSKLNVEVIVVDNGSTDGMRELSKKSGHKWIRWVLSDNVGFSGGNNKGMKVARGKYLFLLNADTVLKKGTLKSLYDYLEENKEVGVVGPQLRFGDGSLQISGYDNYPDLISGFLENTLLDRVFYKLFPNNFYPGKLFSRHMHDQEREVQHLLGAAMFLRGEVYRQTKGFDERFFMFREETDWQRRIRQEGWKIMYYPKIKVTHFEGGSTGQARFKKQWAKKLDYYLPSVYGFEYKWGGWWSSWLLILIYFLGSIFTLFVLLPIFLLNNIFGWVVSGFWKKVNQSVYDIAIYHWAIIKWHFGRWFIGKSVFEDVRGKIVTNK